MAVLGLPTATDFLGMFCEKVEHQGVEFLGLFDVGEVG